MIAGGKDVGEMERNDSLCSGSRRKRVTGYKDDLVVEREGRASSIMARVSWNFVSITWPGMFGSFFNAALGMDY
jgi:cellobiose phosphorylase